MNVWRFDVEQFNGSLKNASFIQTDILHVVSILLSQHILYSYAISFETRAHWIVFLLRSCEGNLKAPYAARFRCYYMSSIRGNLILYVVVPWCLFNHLVSHIWIFWHVKTISNSYSFENFVIFYHIVLNILRYSFDQGNKKG